MPHDWRIIDCLRNGLPVDLNVYDAVLRFYHYETELTADAFEHAIAALRQELVPGIWSLVLVLAVAGWFMAREDSWRQIRLALARAYARLGRYEEAEPELLEAHNTLAAAGYAEVARWTASRLVELYTATGNEEEAERWRPLTLAQGPAAQASPEGAH